MSENTVQEPQEEEELEQPSRIAGGCVVLILAGVAVLILRVVVTVAPYTAYFVAGVLACLGWQKVRAWTRRRRGTEEGEDEAEELPDVAEALRDLGRSGDHVLLTQLRKRLRVADTKTVRALLKDEGIRVRPGVRTSAGNGPGVHQKDIPAPPPEDESGHGDGCCCRSEPTTPTPTTRAGEGPEEGFRVVPLGSEGKIIYDPRDTVRHHRVK